MINDKSGRVSTWENHFPRINAQMVTKQKIVTPIINNDRVQHNNVFDIAKFTFQFYILFHIKINIT